MRNITPQVARASNDGYFSFNRKRIQRNARRCLSSLDYPLKEDIVGERLLEFIKSARKLFRILSRDTRRRCELVEFS